MRRDQLIGTTIANRFHVKRVLGEGGMATVYVAEQDAEPREVALKVLRFELTADRTFAKRFEREAKAAARVQHPNSVEIFDAGVAGNVSYIAMELLRGDDLYALLERHGALSPRTAATIVIEVCEALAVAHGLGIVHRDLKPENIMIVRDPSAATETGGPESVPLPAGARVKVLDFGIAKLLDKQADAPRPGGNRLDPPSAVTAVTRAGTLIGTPAYMSPEQCALLPVDTRSDIYTCGVLLFQMIAARLPFEGPTPLHIATKHIHEDPPPLRSVVPEAHAGLEAVILKALAKRSTERHASAKILGAALRKLLPELPDSPYPSVGRTAEDGLSISQVSTDPYAIDVSVASLAQPDGMMSAKTMVADGLAAPPPSVLVREPEPPRRAIMVLARHAPAGGAQGAEAAAQAAPPPPPPPPAPPPPTPTPAPVRPAEDEPEDLASTLIRGSGGDGDGLAGARDSIPGVAGAGRQVTMQSAASATPAERAARISIVEAPPAPSARAAPIAPTASAPQAAAGAAPPGPGPVFVPVHHAPPPMPSASVILAPALAPAPAQGLAIGAPMTAAPRALAPVEQRAAAPAPTFGLPPAAGGQSLAIAPASRTALWLGIGIGTLLSAVLFALAYVLFLSR